LPIVPGGDLKVRATIDTGMAEADSFCRMQRSTIRWHIPLRQIA